MSREAFDSWFYGKVADDRLLADDLCEGTYRDCAYAAWAAAERATAARCAELCEANAEKHLLSGRYCSVIADHSVRAGGQVDGSEECADAIRAEFLAAKQPVEKPA